MKKIEAETHEVVYRDGCETCCTWNRTGRPRTKDDALALVDLHLAAGRHALALTTRQLDTIGKPVGWHFNSVDWERDHVEYETHHTYWRSHEHRGVNS
jgi:hypothetical protein